MWLEKNLGRDETVKIGDHEWLVEELARKPIPFYRPLKIPKNDLEGLKEEIGQVLDSGLITNGEKCRQFEDQVRRIHGCDYVVACSSCTSGLSMVLQALGTKRLSLPSFTWKSIGYITEHYSRVWQDIDRETWLQINRETHEKADTYLIHNTFGSVSDYFLPQNEANRVYDGAFSFGCPNLPLGDALVMSTTATKTVTSCDGGVILTNKPSLAKKLITQRNICSRMSEVHAVIGLYYVKRLSEILKKKRRIFENYRTKLPYQSQKIPLTTTHGYYGMLIEDRDLLFQKLQGKVECRIRYEPLIAGLPNSDYVAQRILCLPCYPDLDPALVVDAVLEAIK